jgi:hypothetical protein
MQAGSQPSQPRPDAAHLRFEATVHPGEQETSLERVADLDLDRVPDPHGGVRVIITADDAARLVAGGYEVRLLRLLPMQPLDPGLVHGDEAAATWLEAQTRGVERGQES